MHLWVMQGIPCVAVQWGVWAEAGMAASSVGLVARLARQACCEPKYTPPPHAINIYAHLSCP